MKRLISFVLILCTAVICIASCSNKDENKDVNFGEILAGYSVTEIEEEDISNYFFNFAYQRFYSDSLERPMLNSEDYKIKKILTVEDGRLVIFDCSSSNNAKKLYKEFTKMIWERTYYKLTIKVEGKYLLHGDRELVSTVREKIE